MATLSCEKLRPGVVAVRVKPRPSDQHSVLIIRHSVLNFSGARAGVDGIIGSRSHPEIRRLDGCSNNITNPPFFFFWKKPRPPFSCSLYIQRYNLIRTDGRIDTHVSNKTGQNYISFCSTFSWQERERERQTIFQSKREKNTWTTTKKKGKKTIC